MAYIVNKYNGVALATVQDGTTDNSTDLTFIGKNYAGYGEVQNENFLHLLENFANTTDKPPARPVEGQIWYDSTARILKYHNGYDFKSAAVTYGPDYPTHAALGELWCDSVSNKLYSYTGSGERNGFHLIGPDNNTSHLSVLVRTVQDNTGASSVHDVVEILANDVVVAIFNSDEAFEPAESDQIDSNDPSAFASIKKGITLRNTGVDGASFNEYQFWGTASDSKLLGGESASAYALIAGDTFKGPVTFTEDLIIQPGLAGNKLTISEDSSNHTIFSKTGSSSIKFIVNELTNLIISTSSVSPGVTGTVDLGTSATKWKDIYASGTVTAATFVGDLVGRIKDSSGNVIFDATSKTYKGSVIATDDSVILNNSTKTVKGNILAADDTVAYNYTTKTFTGTAFVGTATGANKLVGPLSTVAGDSTNFPPATDPLPYTTVVRDVSGKINAGSITGNAAGADSLFITTTYNAVDWQNNNYKPAVTTPTPNTIVARTSAGNVAANLFNGIATQAYYADLAEKYITDKEYETGTVVVVGGDAEVTACAVGGFAIGVVSKNPAYMMNSGLVNGTYIALKGRVPTKVVGAVKKGDRLIAAVDGCATANNSTTNHCFGIALESNSDISVKLIEVLVL